jgi:hypothetical protein
MGGLGRRRLWPARARWLYSRLARWLVGRGLGAVLRWSGRADTRLTRLTRLTVLTGRGGTWRGDPRSLSGLSALLGIAGPRRRALRGRVARRRRLLARAGVLNRPEQRHGLSSTLGATEWLRRSLELMAAIRAAKGSHEW